jgi:hypothetical protein
MLSWANTSRASSKEPNIAASKLTSAARAGVQRS